MKRKMQPIAIDVQPVAKYDADARWCIHKPKPLPEIPIMKSKALAFSFGAIFVIGLAVATPASAQERLRVWWVKAFYKGEDDALLAMIKKFQAKYPAIQVELSQYPPQDTIPKTIAALDAGEPPDVAYSDVYDFQLTSKWAYEGRLEDLSGLLGPMRERFTAGAFEA